MWLLLTDMCKIKRDSVIVFPVIKNLRKGRRRLGYFGQLEMWLRERRRHVQHPTLNSGQWRCNLRAPWSWRREKVNRNGNGKKNGLLPNLASADPIQHIYTTPPYRLSNGAHGPWTGKVPAVCTQNESSPLGESDQKWFHFPGALLLIRSYNSSEKAMREDSTGVAVALNENSIWNPRHTERNANPMREHTYLDSQATFIID